MLLEVGDDVTNGVEGGEGLVWDDDAVLVLDAHEELEDVKGIGAKVFFDLAVKGDFLCGDAELLG